jgi:hypothetical protein
MYHTGVFSFSQRAKFGGLSKRACLACLPCLNRLSSLVSLAWLANLNSLHSLPRISALVSRASLFRLALALFWAAAIILALSGCGKRSIDSGDGLGQLGNAAGVLGTVRSQIGAAYKYGGASPKAGFDCSGLLYWSFAQNGVRIPRVTADQAKVGRSVNFASLRPGDIVVFRISAKDGLHTGIVSGKGRFIHSPRAGARVREESLDISYWKSRFVSGRRVL